jgi:peptidoglycan/LPS O-acetylase OafA/YrhL
MQPDTIKKKVFFENLDGLRFLCVLSVFLFHSFHTEYETIKESSAYHFIKRDLFWNGNLGVNFFFVLSGFLITYLLIEEKKLNGQVNLRYFWTRRILRIWPLFYFTVLFGFFAMPWLKVLFGKTPSETANIGYYLTFLNNFDVIKNGLPDASMLGVLWSVAIEEQFYFVWPLVLYFVPLKRLWIPFVLVILCSLIFRAFNDSYFMHEVHTFSCMGDLATGAFGAWLITFSGRFRYGITKLNRGAIVLIYVLFFALYFFRDDTFFRYYETRIIERFFSANVILLIILEQCFAERSVFKMSRFRYISQLGVISYGTYCLHLIGMLVAITLCGAFGINRELWQVVLIETPLAFAFTIVFSTISFKYFERPFLRLKERFTFISR